MLLSALAFAACGGTPAGDASLTLYVSAPLSGPRAGDGQDVVDGAELALAAGGGEAGGVDVTVVSLDDATPGGWDAALTGRNARQATEDATTIAYVGELDSGASRTSIPITNQAGILQVSPGASAEDLTRDALGSNDVPDVQATGDRTFGRVVPSDRDQGEAAATWMSDSGIATVKLIGEEESPFFDAIRSGVEAAPSGPAITDGQADASLLASAVPGGSGSGTENPLYATDAQLDGTGGLVSGSMPVRIVSAAMDPSQLPPQADGFRAAFADAYDRDPGRYAAYGYEAVAVILDSIERADDPLDRGAVADAFFATDDRESILGTYSIDGVGNTTLGTLGSYEVNREGEPRPEPQPLDLP